MINEAELNKRFTYHKPGEIVIADMENCRAMCRDLAGFIVDHSPASREQSLALTKLEEVSMWFNAGLARNQEAGG